MDWKRTRERKGKWHKRAAHRPRTVGEVRLSEHARQRMNGRRINAAAIDMALAYGRLVHAQGATHWQIGRKEVQAYALQGVDLTPYEGINVVCANDDGTVVTVMRNREGRRLRAGQSRPWASRR